MSGSLDPTGGVGAQGAAFAMNDNTRNLLLGDSQQFGSMLKSGDMQGAKASLETLASDTQQAVTGFYGNNEGGLNATSARDLTGALNQMAQFGTGLASGNTANAAQFANTMQTALAPSGTAAHSCGRGWRHGRRGPRPVAPSRQQAAACRAVPRSRCCRR